MSLIAKLPYNAKRYEIGAVRRTILTTEDKSIEYFPGIWGLTTASTMSKIEWNPQRRELSFETGNNERNPLAPRQRMSSRAYTVQVRQ